jgi:hypothetical protein
MRADAHVSIASAEVRGQAIVRHAAERAAGGRAFVVSSGLGLPRTWGLTTRAVVEGFCAGIESQAVTGAPRLEAAMRAARARLEQALDSLIEKMVPDATLVGVLLEDGELHVVSCGPSRVYLSRARQPQRLTPRDDPPAGLLRAQPSRSATPLEPGDVILAGSVSAFSVRAIAKLASVLEADAQTPVPVLASLLTEPAGKAGVGAAAVVLRVR